jgi:diadenosine tetraphosphate (Ap4A) HIT family hydrolase
MKLYKRDIWEKTQPEDLWKHACKFCNEHIDTSYQIYETEHWRVIHNKFPVLGLKNQLMAIPKKHYKMAYEIPAEVMAEYPTIEKFVYDFYQWGSYFTFMRESIQNRSMEHIHYHFFPEKVNYKHLEYLLLDQGFTQQETEA